MRDLSTSLTRCTSVTLEYYIGRVPAGVTAESEIGDCCRTGDAGSNVG